MPRRKATKKDLEALQTKAIEEGLPYQTFIASVLHKFAAGRSLVNALTPFLGCVHYWITMEV